MAEERLRRGDIAAANFRNIGSAISGGVREIVDARQQAQQNAHTNRLRAAQVAGAEQQVAAGQREADAAAQDTRRSRSLSALVEMYGPEIPEQELLAVYGPEGVGKITDGLAALREIGERRKGDQHAQIGRVALAALELDEPDQAKMWSALRQSAIAAGMGTAEDIPETATPDLIRSVAAYATGKPVAEPKITYGVAKRFTVDGKTVVAREGSDGFLYDVRGNTRIQANTIGMDEALGGGDSDYARYLARGARDLGKTPSQLTTAEEDRLRRNFHAAARAPERGGTSREPKNPRGSSAIPQGVERYIIDMRNRGYTQEDAVGEILRPEVWGKMQRDHPSMTAQKVRTAIAQLIPEAGAAPVESSATAPPTGAPAGQATAAAPRSMTVAEVRAAAQRMGISEADARRGFEQRGFVIR